MNLGGMSSVVISLVSPGLLIEVSLTEHEGHPYEKMQRVCWSKYEICFYTLIYLFGKLASYCVIKELNFCKIRSIEKSI